MTDYRAILSLASIFALRMLGLFMILPVFSLYAPQLLGTTPALMGVALGIYGLSQACLQIPFGMLSDRFGRKPIITLGLVLFILGSCIAALSHSIYGVILGRLLQGGGAIGSTLIATVADVTREEQRTKAMALIGMSIGLSFAAALFFGPLLAAWINVNGIFWLTAGLGVCGLIVLHTLVPTPQTHSFHRDTQAIPKLFKSVLTHGELLRLNLGIFLQHAILTALFIVLPIVLQDTLQLNKHQQWQLYLPILVGSFIAMVPLLVIAEKKRCIKPIFLIAIASLSIAQIGLWQFHTHFGLVALSLFIYFMGFNFLEATLPSLISKIAPVSSKGTALGIYSSSQFLGIFFGGILGGWLYGNHHIAGVFYVTALMALGWFIVACTMQRPRHLSTKILNLGRIDKLQAERLQQQLQQTMGVAEVAVALEGTAYLKVDQAILDEATLTKIIVGETYG